MLKINKVLIGILIIAFICQNAAFCLTEKDSALRPSLFFNKEKDKKQAKEPTKRKTILELKKSEFLRGYNKNGYFRPGFFGKDRKAIIDRLNEWFGEGNWEICHMVAGNFVSSRRALELYEDAYFEFFRTHLDELEWLVNNAKDVYDNSLSNINSGTDYDKQETLDRHYQDIAIRRVLKRLGRKFEGDEYIQIRGPSSKGYHLNPGLVPFHQPDLILLPQLKGWWEPNSIEAFYQSTKVIILKENLYNTKTLSGEFKRTPDDILREIEGSNEDKEIRFATEKDAGAVSRAHNAAWKGNGPLQVTPETASFRIGRDSRSCIISEIPGENVVGVLWVARINTKGNPTVLNPEVLWDRLTQSSPEQGSDTLICYAIGVIPEVSGKKGGGVSTGLIIEAKEVAARDGLKFVYTLSPALRFEEFKNQHGKILKEKGIPEELWIYAYLISIKDEGPFPYLEYIKEHGYVSIRDYIKITGNRLYCPTEGFHIIGNGAEIGIVLKGARPDCEYSIMYLYADFKGGSAAGIEKKIMEILQSYSGTNSFVRPSKVSTRTGL